MFWKKRKKENKGIAESKSEVIDSGNVKVIVRSDLGNIRLNNEDMGMFYRIADENIIRENVELANKKIYDMASSNAAYHGMGTTCTAIVVAEKNIYYAHVGDSRAYIFKNNVIARITEDHTYVQELVKKGEITAAEAETHPKRNILTNAMGTKPSLRIDTGKFIAPFEKNDKLLLCSDGLYDYLKDEELSDILKNKTLQEAAEYMIQEAKNRGGHDNITVVLAEKTEAEKETTAKETRDFDLPVTKEHELP
jgi:protein phosphatase